MSEEYRQVKRDERHCQRFRDLMLREELLRCRELKRRMPSKSREPSAGPRASVCRPNIRPICVPQCKDQQLLKWSMEKLTLKVVLKFLISFV